MMRYTHLPALVLAFIAALAPVGADVSAQAAPQIPTWIVDADKSTPVPRTQTLVSNPSSEGTYRVTNNGDGTVNVNLSGDIVVLTPNATVDVGVGTRDTLKVSITGASSASASGTYQLL